MELKINFKFDLSYVSDLKERFYFLLFCSSFSRLLYDLSPSKIIEMLKNCALSISRHLATKFDNIF